MSKKTIREISELTGISISALRYYDDEGLFGEKLPRDDQRQRLFDDRAIARLQMILFYRELGMGISELRNIFQNRQIDTAGILNEQIASLRAKAKQFENLASLAEIARDYGISILDFNLDEDSIRKIVKAYRHAEAVDLDRIRNMSGPDRIMIVTSMLSMLESLKELRYRSGRQAKERAFREIENFSSILRSILDIDHISYRSMAKGIAAGGTVTKLLEQFGGEGFSSWLSSLLTACVEEEELTDDGEDASADFIESLLGMWM